MRKKILLCVSGTTPQIITETLYALCFIKYPPFIPDEIHVITTSVGERFIQEKLLDPYYGKFYSFLSEYDIPSPLFNASTIHVIRENECNIEDITTEQHNISASNIILSVVKELCSKEDNWVHASIAGGRKTMSLFLGMSMQFYAKKIDEMSHVLINQPFEGHPEFYYPPKTPKNIMIFDSIKNKYITISTDKAKLSLAMVPFIRLRYTTLYKDIMACDNFTEHINIAQDKLICPIPELTLNTKNMLISINNHIVNFTPMERVIYFIFLEKKMDCKVDVCNTNCDKCYLSALEIDKFKVLNYYKKIVGDFSLRAMAFEESVEQKDVNDWFLQHRARINRKIDKLDLTGLCKLKSVGGYGNRRYGIPLPKERIFIK